MTAPPSALCTPRMGHARGDGTEASKATAPHPGVRGTYSTECANVADTLLAQRGFVRLTLLNGSNTIDLHEHWWARTVSNRRPLVCKTRALPLSYAPYTRRAGYTPRGQDPKPSGR
jgi:hypothetical protein